MICPNCKEELEDEPESERIIATQLIRSYCQRKCSQITYILPPPGFSRKLVYCYETSDSKDSKRMLVLQSSTENPFYSAPKTSLHQIIEKDTPRGLAKQWDKIMETKSFLPFSSQEEFNNLIPRLLKLKAFS